MRNGTGGVCVYSSERDRPKVRRYLQLISGRLAFNDDSTVRVVIRKDCIHVGCHTLTREAFEWLATQAAAYWKPEESEKVIQP